jgi:hypothetical protein
VWWGVGGGDRGQPGGGGREGQRGWPAGAQCAQGRQAQARGGHGRGCICTSRRRPRGRAGQRLAPAQLQLLQGRRQQTAPGAQPRPARQRRTSLCCSSCCCMPSSIFCRSIARCMNFILDRLPENVALPLPGFAPPPPVLPGVAPAAAAADAAGVCCPASAMSGFLGCCCCSSLAPCCCWLASSARFMKRMPFSLLDISNRLPDIVAARAGVKGCVLALLSSAARGARARRAMARRRVRGSLRPPAPAAAIGLLRVVERLLRYARGVQAAQAGGAGGRRWRCDGGAWRAVAGGWCLVAQCTRCCDAAMLLPALPTAAAPRNRCLPALSLQRAGAGEASE